MQEVDFTAEIELDPSICRVLASDQRVSFVLSVFGQSSSKLSVDLGTVFLYLLLLANTLSHQKFSILVALCSCNCAPSTDQQNAICRQHGDTEATLVCGACQCDQNQGQ